jgi:hypothetical protein
MAEEGESKGFKLDPWNYWLFGIMAFFFFLPAFLSGLNISSNESDLRSFFSLSNIIGQGNLILGQQITSLKELRVRNAPAGQILGLQEKLTDGKLVEGPIEQFGTIWWRVNFEQAPSGWVEYDSLTARSGIAKTLYFPVTFYKFYKPIGWVLAFVVLILYFVIKMKYNHQLKIERNKLGVQYEHAEREKSQKTNDARDDLGLSTGEEFKNQRWEHVKELMKSKSQSDWRQAIIEADIILDEMLRRMSYDGLTIGDMLKQVDPADFANLQKAWEAHKFRNEIAHTGSEFKLSKEEAERVISNFQAVFEEFYYI